MKNIPMQIDVIDDFEIQVECNDCGCLYPEDSMKDINGDLICEFCQDNYVTCDRCGELVHYDLHSINNCGDTWCESCYDNYTFRCDECGNRYNINERHEVEDSDICEYCWDNETSCCDGCGEDYFYRNMNHGYCNSCDCHDEDDDDYSSFPGRYHYYHLADEPENPLYYGIELETGTFDDNLKHNWGREILDEIPNCMFVKPDGSIYGGDVVKGTEIVSHPMTYKWMQTNKNKWNKVLRLRKKGLRSYTTNTCGIHIHLTKSWFSEKHLYKFMKMIYHFPSFTKLISQRRLNRLREWASIEDTEDLRKKAKDKHFYKRYTAVNLSNSNTIELRIFRGTLCERSFWKNLEYVQALIEFTNKAKVKDLRVKNFIWFVSFRQDDFPNLYKWLVKKKKIKKV